MVDFATLNSSARAVDVALPSEYLRTTSSWDAGDRRVHGLIRVIVRATVASSSAAFRICRTRSAVTGVDSLEQR